MIGFILVAFSRVVKVMRMMELEREIVHIVSVERRINQISVLRQDRLARALAKFKVASFLLNITFSFVVILWWHFAVEATIERPLKSIWIRREIIKRR